MPTSTDVTNLKINTLTEAQYDTAVQGGVIGANELSIITDLDDAIQVTTLPTASATEEGKIYQFIGTTTGSYTNGYFYKCVSDGQNPATYSWTQVNVQPQGDSLPSQSGHSGEYLTTNGTSASWATINALQNTSTGYNSIGLLGYDNGTQNVVIGYDTNDSATGSSFSNVVIGSSSSAVAISDNTEANVVIGYSSNTFGNLNIAIGASCSAYNGSIQFNMNTMNTATNTNANTFKVANANGNFEIMSADGTIPAARHAALPSADGTYVLKLVIANGVPTLSWVAE